MHEDLVRVAWELVETARSKPGRLRQAYLKRSISTSYYAVFHALARACANELIGSTKTKSQIWADVYRAFDHSQAKNVLIDMARQVNDEHLSFLAEGFAILQQVRHEVDYDPNRRIDVDEAGPHSMIARQAIAALDRLDPSLMQSLAVALVIRRRR